MYLHHTIVPGGLRNLIPDGAATGFSIEIRIGFPRGVPLSLVEGFDVTVRTGGAARSFTAQQVRFRLRGRSYGPQDLADIVDQRWEMGEIGSLEVDLAGGLQPGTYEVTVAQYLRVGPTPEPARTVGSRTLELVPT